MFRGERLRGRKSEVGDQIMHYENSARPASSKTSLAQAIRRKPDAHAPSASEPRNELKLPILITLPNYVFSKSRVGNAIFSSMFTEGSLHPIEKAIPQVEVRIDEEMRKVLFWPILLRILNGGSKQGACNRKRDTGKILTGLTPAIGHLLPRQTRLSTNLLCPACNLARFLYDTPLRPFLFPHRTT